MAKKGKLRWSDAPAAQDYPAAGSYLRLLARPGTVEALASLLPQAPTVSQAAKDILRAAGLPLLPVDDPEVAKDVKKVAKGQPLSPVLLGKNSSGSSRWHAPRDIQPREPVRPSTGGTACLRQVGPGAGNGRRCRS